MSALEGYKTLDGFIANCKERAVYLLFNQSKNGYVSGLTYIMDNGFTANASKIGASFKWNNLKNIINYEQDKQSESISRTNFDTRERFKDLFERRAREIEQNGTTNSRESPKSHTKSREVSSNINAHIRKGYEDRFNSNSTTKSGTQESNQDFEETVSDQFSSRTSAVISSLSSLFNSAGSQVGDDEDKSHKRRKRKR